MTKSKAFCCPCLFQTEKYRELQESLLLNFTMEGHWGFIMNGMAAVCKEIQPSVLTKHSRGNSFSNRCQPQRAVSLLLNALYLITLKNKPHKTSVQFSLECVLFCTQNFLCCFFFPLVLRKPMTSFMFPVYSSTLVHTVVCGFWFFGGWGGWEGWFFLFLDSGSHSRV